jgi:hypothetical protein
MKFKTDIFVDRPVVQVENKYFIGDVSGVLLQHHIFKNVGAKRIVFTGVDFSYSIFERSYFHDCTFIDCKFVGCRLVESNFRGAKFQGCSFEYMAARLTNISHKELLGNLPAWTNAKRELMRSLRINADSVGDVEASKAFVREELAASREHLRKARESKEAYYSKNYSGFGNRVDVYWKSFWGFLDWHLWGHGEYPHKLILAVSTFLVFSSLFLLFLSHDINAEISVSGLAGFFFESLTDVLYSFVGVKVAGFPDVWLALLSVLRYVSLSLFVTVLYKRLVRR